MTGEIKNKKAPAVISLGYVPLIENGLQPKPSRKPLDSHLAKEVASGKALKSKLHLLSVNGEKVVSRKKHALTLPAQNHFEFRASVEDVTIGRKCLDLASFNPPVGTAVAFLSRCPHNMHRRVDQPDAL